MGASKDPVLGRKIDPKLTSSAAEPQFVRSNTPLGAPTRNLAISVGSHLASHARVRSRVSCCSEHESLLALASVDGLAQARDNLARGSHRYLHIAVRMNHADGALLACFDDQLHRAGH